jgi:ATP/ADP translocase
VYAVLPSAVAFFWLYSRATARMTRQALFNTTVAVFALFFAAFPWVHAHVGVLHPHALADVLEAAVPQGLAGAVSM